MKKRSLPIGAALRQGQNKKTKSISTSVSELEDKIAQLERELNSSSSESRSTSGSDEESEDSDREDEEEEGSSKEFIEVVDEHGNVVAIQSRLVEEKIAPLPPTYLPDPNCGATRSKQERRQKKITQPPPQPVSGLEKSIREMLQNYKPTSAERRPFWCRICSFQAQNEEEFYQHRESEIHKIASQHERKFSTCKLCRKEFTSPEQLKEHLKGKAHFERLEFLKSKQKGGRKFQS